MVKICDSRSSKSGEKSLTKEKEISEKKKFFVFGYIIFDSNIFKFIFEIITRN